jgi:hypothetical protein
VDGERTNVKEARPPRPGRRPLTGGSFALIVGIAVVILVSGALLSRKLHQQESAAHAVVYRVTSSSSGASAKQISYIATRSTKRFNAVDLPWSFSGQVQSYKSGAPATVKAQLSKGDTGSITCEVDVDGTLAVTKTASGANAAVACSAPLK